MLYIPYTALPFRRPRNLRKVHEYVGTFRGHEAKFKFTAVTGHVLSLDFKAEFNNWDAVKRTY